jgi:hypothetical protein
MDRPQAASQDGFMGPKNSVEPALRKIRENPFHLKFKNRMDRARDIRHLVMPKMISPQSMAIAQHILGTKNAADMKQFIALVHTGVINNECSPDFEPQYDWTTGRIQCVRRKNRAVIDRVKNATYRKYPRDPDGNEDPGVPMNGVAPSCPGPLDPPTHTHAYVEETEVDENGRTVSSEWKCTLPPVRGKYDCDDEEHRTQLVVGPDGTGYCVVPPGRQLLKSNSDIGAIQWMEDPNMPNPMLKSHKAVYEFYRAFSGLDRESVASLNQFLHRYNNVADVIKGGRQFPLFEQYAKFFRSDQDIINGRNALHMVARIIPGMLATNDDHLRFIFGHNPSVHPKTQAGGRKKKRSQSKPQGKSRGRSRSKSPGKKPHPARHTKPVKVSGPKKPQKKRLSVDLGTLSISDITTTSNLEL